MLLSTPRVPCRECRACIGKQLPCGRAHEFPSCSNYHRSLELRTTYRWPYVLVAFGYLAVIDIHSTFRESAERLRERSSKMNDQDYKLGLDITVVLPIEHRIFSCKSRTIFFFLNLFPNFTFLIFFCFYAFYCVVRPTSIGFGYAKRRSTLSIFLFHLLHADHSCRYRRNRRVFASDVHTSLPYKARHLSENDATLWWTRLTNV
ncbi:hypothetical protein PUN28_004014 [Cardiocondyla obscurior]|uniref:Uncharacterized protein n=1 Tax=Cardiocondyla obscurior TaxID=286306 RepID=A0AAW2GLU3_9HYME